MAMENTVSSDFDLRLSIVKSIFDCSLPGVLTFSFLVSLEDIKRLVVNALILSYSSHRPPCLLDDVHGTRLAMCLAVSYVVSVQLPAFHVLTLYSIIRPFDALEISHIRKYFGKRSICSFGASTSFSIVLSKVFKT